MGSGKPFDPEKQRPAEIIDRLNDIFGSEVDDADQRHCAQGIANRLERDDSLMAQLDQHDEAQLMHGMFPKKVTDAVLDALSDHEKLSMPLLEDEETGKLFALLIPKLLAGRSGRDSQTGKSSIGFSVDEHPRAARHYSDLRYSITARRSCSLRASPK